MKKIFAIILVISIVLGIATINVSADGNTNTGIIPYDESQEIPIEYTEEQLLNLEEKHRLLEAMDENVSTYSLTWSFLEPFTLYSQINNHYCAPACVQSVLKYINGSAPSQITIASGCNTTSNGTTMPNMINYLNTKQTANVYEGFYVHDQTRLARYLYFDIHNRGIPSIISFACSTDQGWLYDSNGHVSCVVSARDDRGAFVIADPLVGYLGYEEIAYIKTIGELYEVFTGLCW